MIRKLSIKEVGSINLEKNISSWCVKAEVKIKKRTKYHFIDKQRLYFNISKAAAIKSFKNEFKLKQGA